MCKVLSLKIIDTTRSQSKDSSTRLPCQMFYVQHHQHLKNINMKNKEGHSMRPSYVRDEKCMKPEAILGIYVCVPHSYVSKM